ncbi:MAG: DUF2946 family protein [Pseudomonadota bacterium]|nr:MAG: DUF2946 family protein [Pseudomonadota bacterium]
MAKNWTLILFAVLMVVQSLSIAADVLPIHSDHQPHELADMSGGDGSTQATDPSPGSDHNTPPGHCHSCHCHGSHMLLSMQLPTLSTASSGQVTLRYTVDHPSPHIAAILRPPIA